MRLDNQAKLSIWWGLNREPSDSAYNTLIHQATLPEHRVRIVELSIYSSDLTPPPSAPPTFYLKRK